MAQVVGFVSEKGGVGKTTAVYHIGVSLKRDHGAKILLLLDHIAQSDDQ